MVTVNRDGGWKTRLFHSNTWCEVYVWDTNQYNLINILYLLFFFVFFFLEIIKMQCAWIIGLKDTRKQWLCGNDFLLCSSTLYKSEAGKRCWRHQKPRTTRRFCWCPGTRPGLSLPAVVSVPSVRPSVCLSPVRPACRGRMPCACACAVCAARRLRAGRLGSHLCLLQTASRGARRPARPVRRTSDSARLTSAVERSAADGGPAGPTGRPAGAPGRPAGARRCPAGGALSDT